MDQPTDKAIERIEKEPDEDAGDNPTHEAAQIVEPSRLVAEDLDRPVADNTKVPAPLEGQTDAPVPDAKKLKQKEYQRQYREKRKAEREGKPPPNFGDLKGGIGQAASKVEPPRNYAEEFATIFIPCSMFAGQFLGDHWLIKIDQEKKAFDFTPAQQNLIATGGRWFEYEKFGPATPRLGFALALASYLGQNVRIEPTPTKIKGFFTWCKTKWKKWRGEKVTDDRDKRMTIQAPE
jgi:hypothetical protein